MLFFMTLRGDMVVILPAPHISAFRVSGFRLPAKFTTRAIIRAVGFEGFRASGFFGLEVLGFRLLLGCLLDSPSRAGFHRIQSGP